MKKFHSLIYFAAATLVGLIAFYTLYGFTILDPRVDNWIMQGFDEPDLLQHYAGWCMYRSSGWHFPLGLADNMGLGTYISFTDSIPLVAIISKAFLQLIRYQGTFQYFGLFTLLCYILQAYAGGLLIKRRSANPIVITLSMVLFAYSPILMERAIRHTALGAQWLILFAMYAYLTSRDNNYDHYPLSYIALACLAITIHPYFLPMVMVFALMTVIEGLVKNKNYKAMLIPFALTFVATIASGLAIGVIGTGVSSSRAGYGFFSFNLNAMFNPSSKGGYTWSAVLTPLGQLEGNYDGFTYLGIGMMVATTCAAIIALIHLKQTRDILKRNWLYILLMAIMVIFAITNVVTLGDKILFTIPLPQALIDLGGIFRASARMVYPAYYTLFVLVIYTLIEERSEVTATAVVLCLVALQLFDLHYVISEKKAYVADSLTYDTILDDAELAAKLSNYDAFVSTGYASNMAILAGKNNMQVYYSVANSGDYSEGIAKNQAAWDELYRGNHSDNEVFITVADRVDMFCNINPDLEPYESYGFYFLFPSQAAKQDLPNFCCIKEFSDSITGGVNLSTGTLQFTYSDTLLDIAKAATKVTALENTINITDVTYDDNFIYITVDGDASGCVYPNAVTIE